MTSIECRDGSIVVLTDYSMKEAIKVIPGRRWNAIDRSWTLPETSIAAMQLQEAFSEVEYQSDGRFQELLSMREMPLSTSMPKTKTEPMAHQIIGYNMIQSRDSVYLAWEMGTGKTWPVVQVINQMPGVSKVLIVCPKSVTRNWIDQLNDHSFPEQITAQSVFELKGKVSDRAQLIQQKIKLADHVAGSTRRFIFIVNFDSVWRGDLGKTILETEWDMVIADEIHRIKGHGTKVSTFFDSLRSRAKTRVGLSGTPMNTPLDLFAQCRFLDEAVFGTSFVIMKINYAVTRPLQIRGSKGLRTISHIVGYKDLGKLRQRFGLVAHRVKKKEVLDLPPVMHQKRSIQLSKRAVDLYKAIESDFLTMIGDEMISISNVLVEMIKLQQVTSGAVFDDDKNLHEVDDGKENALRDILSDLPLGEPVVVFARFTHDLAVVERVCAGLGIGYCQLGDSRNELEQWQHPNEVKKPDTEMGTTDGYPYEQVLGANIRSGGLGVDMSRARYAIFFSVGFSFPDHDQAMARLHRKGQERSVQYIHLIADGTIDSRIYEILARRSKDVSAIIDGDGAVTMERADLATELVQSYLEGNDR